MKALSTLRQIPHTTLSRTLYDTLWKRLKEICFRGQEQMGILHLVPGWVILIEPRAAGNLQRDRFLSWGSSWRLTTRRLSLIGSIAWKPSAPDGFHEAQSCLLCDVYEWNLSPKSSSWFEKKKPGRMSHWSSPLEHVCTGLGLILKSCNFSVMLQRLWEAERLPPPPSSPRGACELNTTILIRLHS